MLRILVVGCGSLGCEVASKLRLENLQFVDVILVDHDTIEVSNLSRQLLFRNSDCGMYKASVAGRRLNYHSLVSRVEELPLDYFRQFHLILCAVDDISTRLWLNEVCISLKVPMVEGGSEGWLGHVRLVVPHQTPCLACTKHLYGERDALLMCTLKGRPTTIEHCVAWALTQHDTQNSSDDDDLCKVVEMAQGKAAEHAISGRVDINTVRGLVRRIIPAMISINAIIAGVMVLITRQLLTDTFALDSNFWFVNGQSGFYFESHKLESDEDCPLLCTPK